MASIGFLNDFSFQWTIYSSISILAIGLVGNSLNLLVFLSLKTFRENSCSFYLLAMSCLNLGQLITSLLPRIINLWSPDWGLSSLIYCKIRVYFFQVCSSTSLTCMCLATMDQYLATSAHMNLRRLNNVRVAHLFVSIAFVVWFLHGIPSLIYYNQTSSMATLEATCIITNPIFQAYITYGYTLIILTSLPVSVTVIFGILAYRNVTELAYRALPVVRRDLDKQLTFMVLVHVVYTFCVILPYIVVNMINLGVNTDSSSYSYAQLELAKNIAMSLFYVYFAVSITNRIDRVLMTMQFISEPILHLCLGITPIS